MRSMDERPTPGDLAQGWDPAVIERADYEHRGRQLVKARYPSLFAAVTDLFFRIDPVGINFETNTDEYEPEVGTVLPRLELARSVADVREIVREELVVWFGRPYEGEATDRLASELWSLWQTWKSTET